MTDAIGQTHSWTYDSHGDVLNATDKRGNATTFTIRPQRRAYSRQSIRLATRPPTTYDAVGNRLSMTDANGHTTPYTYDADNRLIRDHGRLLATQPPPSMMGSAICFRGRTPTAIPPPMVTICATA